jgi:chemotaxis protein methyltransferase CheR
MSNNRTVYEASLTAKEFLQLSEFIQESVGIKMPPEKKIMLEGRLRKRLRNLGIDSFSEYLEYLFSQQGMKDELVHMIDVITTNKTDFFREPAHFDFLIQNALPDLITSHGSGIGENLMTWSAGCSTGEEAYSIAMVLEEFGAKYPGFKFGYRILATDISTKVLEIGMRAVYDEEKTESVPVDLREKYILRSKDTQRELIRIIPRLRERVKFRRLNFLDEDFGFRERMDIIFCRNVLIYFEKTIQEKILRKIIDYLKPGGFLFIGHSETLLDMDLPLQMTSPTIYRRVK